MTPGKDSQRSHGKIESLAAKKRNPIHGGLHSGVPCTEKLDTD